MMLALALFACSNSSTDTATTPVEVGFGERIAGSYYLELTHDGYPDARGLAHITRDGGFIASDMSDFGAQATTRNTPVYGSWLQTSETTLATRTIYFGFDDAGEPKAITRTTGTFEFDEGLTTGTGDMFIELFDPAQDPLSEDEEPFDTLTGTAIARRITVPG